MIEHKHAFNGWTESNRIEDGALILFGLGEEPRQPFDEGREIHVVLPSGKVETLYGMPSHGPTHVDWFTPARMHIVFPLEQVEPGTWRIRFKASHEGILDMGRPAGT